MRDSPEWKQGRAGTTRRAQLPLIEWPTYQQEEWVDMPAFEQKDLQPLQTVRVHLRNEADRKAFAALVGQQITPQTKYIWYPAAKKTKWKTVGNLSESTTPKYPIYIISKGRWESRQTSRALEAINVAYKIVVEPQEYDDYAAVIDPANILVLPFSNLGQGSIPARNWVWEHSLGTGAARHWILDDNISMFLHLAHNTKTKVVDGSTFVACEEFTDRYDNIAMSGMNYEMFAPQRVATLPAFYLNTRIYSCILLSNALPHRWRGRYNEDTDLSLRLLKDGYCTVLFNAFLAKKTQTLTMKGGNTDELYKDDGRLKMAQSLQEQHPDVVTITEKWGRPQHQVYYKGFKQKLIPTTGG